MPGRVTRPRKPTRCSVESENSGKTVTGIPICAMPIMKRVRDVILRTIRRRRSWLHYPTNGLGAVRVFGTNTSACVCRSNGVRPSPGAATLARHTAKTRITIHARLYHSPFATRHSLSLSALNLNHNHNLNRSVSWLIPDLHSLPLISVLRRCRLTSVLCSLTADCCPLSSVL